MTGDGTSGAEPAAVCRECGYPLAGADSPVCPECGRAPDAPVSGGRRLSALLLYFACLIPLIEAVVLAGWAVQHVLVPPQSRSTKAIAIGASVLGVVTTLTLSNLFRYRDAVFARLRLVSLVIAILVGLGLLALALFRSGGHGPLLYTLVLLNAGLAYLAMVSKGVPVGVLEAGDAGATAWSGQQERHVRHESHTE